MIPNAKKSIFTTNEIVLYLAIVLKHLRLATLLLCVSLLVGLNYYCYSRAVYHSRSFVRIQVLERPIDSQTVFRDSTEQLVRKQFTSQTILMRTAKKLGAPSNLTTSQLERDYIKKVRVESDGDGNLIVEVWPYSYAIARDWTQTMVSEYLQWKEEKHIEYREALFKSYSEDMAAMKAKMDNIFDLKLRYHDTNELTRILIELNELKEIPREIFVVKHRLSLIERTRENLNNTQFDTVAKLSLLAAIHKDLKQINIGQIVPSADFEKDAAATGQRPAPPVVVVPGDLATPQEIKWEEMDKERRLLKQRYDELTAQKLMPGHPKMVVIAKQYESANRFLELELENALHRLDMENASLKDTLTQLEAKLPAYNEITRRHQKYSREYSEIDGGQLAWNTMFNEMQKKIEALDFGGDKERAQVQFMYHFEVQEDPVSPNRAKTMLSFLMVGLGLAIAVPFLFEYLNASANNVEQVEEALQIRGLGIVPMLEEGQQEASLHDISNKPDYHLQENFRLIRTNLILNAQSPDFPQQVIMVTSAMRQEGKSTVASNLAMSFAQKGERVLLIDADLRRGRLHRAFGCNGKPGLSDVLRENAALEQAFRSTARDNLTLLTCGKHLNSAPELLGNASFSKLMESLRQKYDRIILDTPPVLGLAEAAMLQKLSDAVVFVIWSEFTSIRNVKAALTSLQLSGPKFAGFVLNRFDFRALGNRYQYFYYAPNYYSNYKVIEAPSA
ncbi:MAG: Capsular exopolysaccharide family [Verrucomicrobiales bacterium]|nr:Capsular exopolysaccharide family [Verrucomicrobiales bacterium]